MAKITAGQLLEFLNSGPKNKDAIINLGTEKNPKYVNAKIISADTSTYNKGLDKVEILIKVSKAIAKKFGVPEKYAIRPKELIQVSYTFKENK